MNDDYADAPHIRNGPELMAEIMRVDAEMSEVRERLHGKVVRWSDAIEYSDLQLERAGLRASAHKIYGHTPAHGGRGPSSAGAMSA